MLVSRAHIASTSKSVSLDNAAYGIIAGMPAAPDFRLYHSNDLGLLAQLLAQELRVAADENAILRPDLVLIPQAAMKRWLLKVLAERYGIAANLAFLTPGEYVGRLLAANLSGSEDAGTIDPDILQWRLYAVLRDPAALAHPALAAALGDYLAGSAAELKAWSLAGTLGDAFAKYQAWRRDWLLRWDRGADSDDWQAELWRRASVGRRHRAKAIDTFLRRHGGPDSAAPIGLASRVFAFACLNVSPDVLRVLATSARASTLHFYLPMPTRRYWGDLRSLRERLAAHDPEPLPADENPLLAQWGRAGRDFVATLFSDETLAVRDIEAYVEPDPSLGLLQWLKRDLLHRQAPTAVGTVATMRDDRSLQIHVCHTRLREVQVLHDQLRALLEDDPSLQPRDIAVMAPDINTYAAHIAAVFGAAQGSSRFVPYSMADASTLTQSSLADLLLRVLDLPQARLSSNEVLELLALPAVMRQFGIEASQLDQLREWLLVAGARWGLDAAHRARVGAPAEHAFTFAFAVERLLLGYASASDADIAGVAPWPELEGNALDAVDALLRLLRLLARLSVKLGRAQRASEWAHLLTDALHDLVSDSPADPLDRRALAALESELRLFAQNAVRAEVDPLLAPEVLRAHLRMRLSQADSQQPFLSGGVTFCRMVPMRLIPFRVICLLGMNDGEFPRREPAVSLNRLIAALDHPGQRRIGDRSLRDDDRYLFLQLLNAAERVFYLSYLGCDPSDGSRLEPALPVSELLDVAACYFDQPAQARQQLPLQHALQTFAEAPNEDPRRYAFDPTWRLQRPTAVIGAAATLVPLLRQPLSAQAEPERVALPALRSFLSNPPRSFLRQRLGVQLPGEDERLPEYEPFAARDGLEASTLERRVLQALVGADSQPATEQNLLARLQAEALLPPGAAGEARLSQLIAKCRPIASAWNAWHQDRRDLVSFELRLGDRVLFGQLDAADHAGFARGKPGKPSGRDWLRWYLDALVAAAIGDSRPVCVFAQFEDGGVGPLALPVHAREQALATLAWLLQLMALGQREPLPFRPHAGWLCWQAIEKYGAVLVTDEDGAGPAQQGWRNHLGQGEGSDPWTTLALRAAEPFSDAAATARFTKLSCAIFAALRDANVPEVMP